MLGLSAQPKGAKGVLKVFSRIDALLVEPGTTRDILAMQIEKEFTIKKLVRAFIASVFCIQDYMQVHVDYLHSNLRSGIEYRANSYVSPCKQLLDVFCCQPFNFSLKNSSFCLFYDAEDLRVPIKDFLSGYALILLKIFMNQNSCSWFKKTKNSFSGTPKFQKYVNKITIRPSWVKYLLKVVVVLPITRTTNDETHKAIFDIALQMFNNIDDSKLLIDKNWFDQGRQLLIEISQNDIQKDESPIALEYFLRLLENI